MIFLWAFSPEIEDAMGSAVFCFLLCWLTGDYASPGRNQPPISPVPNLGASGAIAALMGAFLVTYPRDRIRTVLFFFVFVGITFILAALLVGFWFLTQLFSASAVAQVQTGGVAYLAHIGGFIFGAATACLLEDPRRIAWQRSTE